MATQIKDHRNLLFVIKSKEGEEEYREFALDMRARAFFASSAEEAIYILNRHKIDQVILILSSINEVGLIKYINDYFDDIRVIIVTTKDFNDIISIFNKGKYKVVNQPVKLTNLKKELKGLEHIT